MTSVSNCIYSNSILFYIKSVTNKGCEIQVIYSDYVTRNKATDVIYCHEPRAVTSGEQI